MRTQTPQKAELFACAPMKLLLGVFAIFLCAVIFFSSTIHSSAATLSTINFQARLENTTGSIAADGNYNIEFKLYNASTGGTALWTETYQNSNSQGIQVINGYVTVNLGAITSFPSTINWDQDLYLTMNVGGTSTSATPTYDGEMTPRLKLTAVPYAFRAGQLAKLSGANTSTLDFASQTGARSILLPDESGTLCIQNSTNCGFLTGTAASGSYVQLQGASPGTVQTGNFNISGTGIANLLQAAVINATTKFQANGTDGATTSCSSGNVLQNAIIQGGIITGGTCVANGGGVSGVTLQATSPGTADVGNFNVTGAGIASILQGSTKVLTPLLDTASAGVLNVGTTNATQINLNKNVVLAASQYLTLTGSGTRPSSPTEGMLYYDTTAKTLLIYANGKWQSYAGNTATKIVAMGATTGCTGSSPVASVASDGADYVSTSCTSSQTTINSAITALPSGGGTVYLMEGTYIIDGSILMGNNTRLVGSGPGTVIKLKDGINANINAISNNTTSAGMVLENLMLDGNKANNTSGTQHGFYILNGGSATQHSVAISKVTVRNFRNNGLDFWQNNYTTVTDSNFMSNDIGVNMSISNNNATIDNNQFVSNTTRGLSLGSSGNLATGNTLASNGVGIYVGGSNNQVTGNLVRTSTGNGITINSSTAQNNVSGNEIYGNTGAGISIGVNSAYNTISSNAIYSNNGAGISTSAGSNNNSITGNKLYDNTSSTASSSIDIDGTSNRISNNQINDTAGTGYAIRVAPGAATIQLSGNTYAGTGASSISDSSSSTIYADQFDSNGNIINRNQGGLTVGKTSASYTLDIQGSARTTTLTTPNAPSLVKVGATGTQTWGYKVSALDGFGETLASTETTITNGVTPLTGANYVTINWTPVGGAVQYKVYRTTSGGTPATTGLIGTVSGNVFTFNDTAIAATGSVPASNTTGAGVFAGALQGGSSLTLGTSSSLDASIIFRNATNSNTMTLVSGATSTSFTTVLPSAIGTAGQCLAVASVVSTTQTLGYATCGGGGAGSYVTLQGSTPGTADTGNFNVSGTGIAAVFKAADFDRTNAGTLTFGNTNATTINIGTNGAAHSINIGTGAAAQTIAIGSTNTTSSLSLQTGTSGFSLNTSGTTTFLSDLNGSVTFIPIADQANIFQIQNTLGNDIFSINSNANNVNSLISLGAPLTSTASLTTSSYIYSSAWLTLANGSTATYTTPVGSAVPTKINVQNYNPGAFGQVLALGIPGGAGTFDTSRVLSVFDARSGNHQPSIAVFSPDENNLFGLSWDGSNSNALLKNTASSSSISLAPGTVNHLALTAFDSGNVRIGATTDTNPTDFGSILTIQNDNARTTTAVSGTNGSDAIRAFGMDGGGTTGTSGQTGGNGGGYLLQAGNGGNAASGSTNGNGGSILLAAGAAGSGAGTAGTAGSVKVKNLSNSSQAFVVQNTAGSSVLTVNTSSASILLGQASSLNGVLVFANATNGNTVTLQTGATTASYTTQFANAIGTAGQCVYIASVAGGVQTLGYTTCGGGGGGSGVTSLNTLTGALVIQGTTNRITVSAAGTTVTLNTPQDINTTSNVTFGALTVGDATNYVQLVSDFSTTGRLYGGTGRPTRQIKLVPEFAGAVLTADGTNNSGFMTSDRVTGLASGEGYKHNYYAWATDQATAQDYDIAVSYQLPSDFDGFVSSSFKFWVYADSLTSTNAQVMITDASGVSCYASLQSIAATSAATWQQKSLSDPANGCTFAANDIITISIKPTAISPQTNYVKIGELQFDYKAKF